MTVATYQWTLDRYHQAIAADLFDDQNLELLRGALILMPPEGEPHVYFSDRAANILREALEGQAQVREGRPITLPNQSEPQPDIAILQLLDTVYLEHHPYPENIFWLIEYSHSTLNQDLGHKQGIYAEAGIREYWVVNLKDRQLTVFRDPASTGYRYEQTFTQGTISPLTFPELTIVVPQLFRV